MAAARRSVARSAALRTLGGEARRRLVRSARAAGDDAEDAVQDVLVRLADGVGDLPSEPERLHAYATRAVGRRSRELAARPRPLDVLEHALAVDDALEERLDARRRLRAYAAALGGVPAAARDVLLLDAAGWSRTAIAGRCGLSPRAVKRVLDEHRDSVLAQATRAVDGSDCARLAGTLAAYAASGRRPRRNGPAATHLALCAPCRSALLRARATRRALRSLLPPPVPAPLPPVPAEAGAIPLLAGAAKAPWLAALATTAAVGLGLGGVAGSPGREAPPAPAPAAVRAVLAPPASPATTTAPAGPVAPRPAPLAARAAAPAPRRKRPGRAAARPPLATPLTAPRGARPAPPGPTPLQAPRVTSVRRPAAPRPAPGEPLCDAQGLC